MDDAIVGRQVGGTEDRRIHQRRDRAEDAPKNEIKPWLREQWVIPPDANAEFVCQMEEVLDVYQRPFDPKRPLVTFDEAMKQLVKHTRATIPATPGQPEIIDYEYERHGTGNLFLFSEPLAGRRKVLVTARRTAIDDAQAIRHLVDVRHPEADQIVLVQDNLHTHKVASLYAAFPPTEARRLIDKLEIHDTPKQGSGLNLAEIELGVLGRQCLAQRIPDLTVLESEVAAGERARHAEQVRINWPFTTADARIKLKRLYPVIEPINLKMADH